MTKYKITVEEVVEREYDKYARNITLYEQTIEGDATIVNSVVQTVLEYNSHLFNEPASPPLKEERADV
jgi:hypothetical protein